MDDLPVPPWRLLGRERGPDLLLFRVRWDLVENPRTRLPLRRLVLETPPWVNVVARTRAGELLLVRQHRFGIERESLEIPGGIVDPGEEHAAAARRELREETGHEAARWRYLGASEANPAFQDNLCHHWLAEDAHATGEPTPDAGEDLRVATIPWSAVPAAVQDGRIRHSLVVAALARVLDLSLSSSSTGPP